jgi:DNA-damage-inducible protein D
MKQDLNKELFEKFEAACYKVNGVECWSARELQDILGYKEWRNFLKVIDKAKEAVVNSGDQFENHFVEINKMVIIGSGSTRSVEDIAITRYACYLIAQNGDPSKPAIAFAQTYFAVQTRRAEIVDPVVDLLPTISIKAKDLAAEMTSLNVQTKDLKGQSPIEQEHIDNNVSVRNMLLKRGIRLEELLPAEDVK